MSVVESVQALRMRPRLECVVPEPPPALVDRLRQRLGAFDALTEVRGVPRAGTAEPMSGSPVQCVVSSRYLELTIREAERRFWSPYLSLEIQPCPEGTRLTGRFAPHPHVWGLYIAVYAFTSFLTLGGVMFGVSQSMLGDPPTGFFLSGAALFVILLIYLSSFVGRGLSGDQIYQIRSFLDDLLKI